MPDDGSLTRPLQVGSERHLLRDRMFLALLINGTKGHRLTSDAIERHKDTPVDTLTYATAHAVGVGYDSELFC